MHVARETPKSIGFLQDHLRSRETLSLNLINYRDDKHFGMLAAARKDRPCDPTGRRII